MPTYIYECNKCEEIFELFQSMTENMEMPPTHCPTCDPEMLEEGTMSKHFGYLRPGIPRPKLQD
jgi:putative FmdB family regulatory protein